ncbi:MAG: hypothetical protein Q9159_003381 [Coniocarpon cinnabarinum]
MALPKPNPAVAIAAPIRSAESLRLDCTARPSPSSPGQLPPAYLACPETMSTIANGGPRPSPTANRHSTAPSTIPTMNGTNGHFAANGGSQDYEHGVQVISAEKEFNSGLPVYLQKEHVTQAGFNYHLISVFGSQSTGKSTLLNYLFGTDFSVMSEDDRRQTTKGIWLSKNRHQNSRNGGSNMADNILVMDVEGTDGRERGEDQDFERKSALFALATSEVLIVNIWEHQVGLYQGANMGLLKTVFEVNLQLFLKDQKSVPRSLLYFVIRDHLGQTPLQNLKSTLMQDLSRMWASLSKPKGLENSKIQDYFDFAFVALPHKVLQPEKFASEIERLGTRFREGTRNPKLEAAGLEDDSKGVLLPEYHRRIPADGFSHYASSIWDQIVDNKDLDLPTQQELLAQFRCDEIMREVLVPFDERISPLEHLQQTNTQSGKPGLIPDLGPTMKSSRSEVISAFSNEASRYHKAVYSRKLAELEEKTDTRLRALFQSQLSAAHKLGVVAFGDAVSEEVRQGQKRGSYDFAAIVETSKKKALSLFDRTGRDLVIENVAWTSYKQELKLFQKELEERSASLRKEEMRRLANRVERYVKSKLSEKVSMEFNSLGQAKHTPTNEGDKTPSERELWDRIWRDFTQVVQHAEDRFTNISKGFDASPEEVEVGLWRLRRKSWTTLRAKLEEEVMEGNLLLKLRENFEDKFRYDSTGVPRIWRPTDDIEGIYTESRRSTLLLIPVISRFQLNETAAPPPLDAWIGETPKAATSADEEDLTPIGGVDADSNSTLDDECTILADSKASDLATRFKKTADGVFVEAKRSAIGGMTQIPLYFYVLLVALGWNEIMAVLKNPLYFIMLMFLGIFAYITYTMNMWGPMLRMADGASRVAIEEGKKKLRDFLEAQEGVAGPQRRPVAAGDGEEYEMQSRRKAKDDDDDDVGDI